MLNKNNLKIFLIILIIYFMNNLFVDYILFDYGLYKYLNLYPILDIELIYYIISIIFFFSIFVCFILSLMVYVLFCSRLYLRIKCIQVLNLFLLFIIFLFNICFFIEQKIFLFLYIIGIIFYAVFFLKLKNFKEFIKFIKENFKK